LSQNAGLRDSPRPYVRLAVPPNPFPEPESPMSRRQLTIVVLTLATSLVATACGTAPTAPSHDAPIVVVGSGG